MIFLNIFDYIAIRIFFEVDLLSVDEDRGGLVSFLRSVVDCVAGAAQDLSGAFGDGAAGVLHDGRKCADIVFVIGCGQTVPVQAVVSDAAFGCSVPVCRGACCGRFYFPVSECCGGSLYISAGSDCTAQFSLHGVCIVGEFFISRIGESGSIDRLRRHLDGKIVGQDRLVEIHVHASVVACCGDRHEKYTRFRLTDALRLVVLRALIARIEISALNHPAAGNREDVDVFSDPHAESQGRDQQIIAVHTEILIIHSGRGARRSEIVDDLEIRVETLYAVASGIVGDDHVLVRVFEILDARILYPSAILMEFLKERVSGSMTKMQPAFSGLRAV